MKQEIRISYILTMLLALFLFSGCVEEDTRNVPHSGSTLELPIRLTKSLSGLEIKKYRILVYSNGALVSNTEVTNTQDDSPTTRVKVAKGINNFYVFCNETAELKAKIDNIANENDLENITFTSPAAGTSVDIPMYGKILNANVEVYESGVNVTVNGITKTMLTVDVDRLMVKLSLTFIKNVEQPNEDFVIDELKINIHQMPKITSIKGDVAYTTTDWAQSLSLTGSGTIANNGNYIISNGNYSIPGGVDNIKFRDIYIPEHILVDAANADQATHVTVDVTYHKNGDVTPLRTAYIINLGQVPPSDYNLKRNNHIDIYATIRKLGEGLITSFNIVPWNDGGIIDVEEPEGMYYLNLSVAYVKYPHMLYINKDHQVFGKDESGNLIPPLPYSYSCHFWTNRPSSTISVTDFINDQEPSKIVGITQSMTITDDNTVGGTHDVKGKIDINIPSQDIAQGLSKSYSMRLKSDLLNRKLTFAITDFDILPFIIDPGFTQIPDIVITNHGTSSAKSTEESFEFSVYLPRGATVSYTINPTGSMSITLKDITPAGTDVFAPRLYSVKYKSSSPRSVTLGARELELVIKSGTNTIYTSPFKLNFNIKKP